MTPPGSGGTPATPSGPGVTTAQGAVVDDASGAPVAGVPVRLDPWAAYPTPGPTPSPILTTVTDANGRFTITAPNGAYLLVIGADAVNTPPPGWSTPQPGATDTPVPGASGWQATIHDKIVLAGQTTLVAPTMPPQPLYTPPATERGGLYRIATLSALTEAPCVLAFNQQRQAHGLAPAVVDEWSVENTRAIAYVGMNPNGAGQTVRFLTTGNAVNSGGANCSHDTLPFASSAATQWLYNAETQWFGGFYSTYANNTQGFGAAEYPIDPRVYTDQNGLIWP